MCLEHALYRKIEVVAGGVFKREFEAQKLKTKKAQLSYFSDNGLTSLDYRQYLKHLSDGHQPWTACRWPRNIDWLIERCNAEERSALDSLRDSYSRASQERELAAKQIVTRIVA
ncbi:hypothetical protein ADT25_17835 [Xanthomonas oryzae]|uniref:Uncharacterized protein n=1 Tax=Xanthomonas oryzae TaxID=347 RepID=A0AAP0ZIT9_9XANT|nr:hypothetical protein ADT25_17835 [Xanthomonas oryzae]